MELIPINTENNNKIERIKIAVPIRACVACKKRKGKCEGRPCSHCIKKGIECEFREMKRRGPISKKMKVDGSEEEPFLWLLNQVQDTMNLLFQQCNFVDFYFAHVGVAIPQEYKLPLLKTQNNNKDYTTQLCVIFAHIMRCFNNSEAQNHYISKARRYAANMFDSDTIESAVSLIMMSIFEGNNTHKGGYFANMAYNILKLPSVNTTPAANKLMRIAHGHSIALDASVSFYQRSANLLASLPPATYILDGIFEAHELALLCKVRQQAWAVVHLNMNWSDLSELIQNISSPVVILPTEMEIILKDIEILCKITNERGHEFPTPFMVDMMRCHIDVTNFYLAWRTGNNEGAIVFADSLMDRFRANPSLPGIMLSTNAINLAVVPYFFERIGQIEKTQESLQVLDICYCKLGAKNQLEEALRILDVKSKIPTCSFSQIEQELLNTNPATLPNESDFDEFLKNNTSSPVELLDIVTQSFSPV